MDGRAVSRRIRLLLTIPNFDTAGSGLVVVDILRRVDRDLIDPVVCVLRRGGLDHLVEDSGVPVVVAPFCIPARPRHTLWRRVREAAEELAPLEIDVQHSWHYRDDYTEPLVAKAAGVGSWIYTKKNFSWGGNGWRLRSLLASRIAVNNPAMVDAFYRAPWFRRKVEVVPQGVDLGRFSPGPPDGRLRSRLGIERVEPLIGYVARLTPDKGQDTLVRAVATARTRPHLVLVGRPDPGYDETLRGAAHELGISERVHHLGQLSNDELPKLLRELDIFAFASRHDGLPVALLEAMACGVACVATRCGGPEQVIRSPEGGILVNVDDPVAMASAFDRLAGDPGARTAIGRAARQRVASEFGVAQQAARYQSIYRELARARTAVP